MKLLFSLWPVKMNSSLPQVALRWIAPTRPWYYGVHTQFAGGDVMLNKENIDINGNIDWLHRNSSYQHHKFDNDSIHSNTSYFYYSGLSRSLMFTIRFSRKTMMPFSTNSNFMYIFKQQQYYRFHLCRFVLHACIGLMYNFIVFDSVTKSWAYMYIIVMKNWSCWDIGFVTYYR